MLHARAAMEVDVLFDLGLLLTMCGLVDGHFDQLVRGGMTTDLSVEYLVKISLSPTDQERW